MNAFAFYLIYSEKLEFKEPMGGWGVIKTIQKRNQF